MTVDKLLPIVKRIRTLVNRQIKDIKDLHSDSGFYYGEDFSPLKKGIKISKDIASNKGKLTNLFKIAKNFAFSEFSDLEKLKSIRNDILNKIGGKFESVDEERKFWSALQAINKYAVDLKYFVKYLDFVDFLRDYISDENFDINEFENKLKNDVNFVNDFTISMTDYVSNKKGGSSGGFFR